MDELTFISEPRISREAFIATLQTSPIKEVAGQFYDLIREFGIDPAIALMVAEYEGALLYPGSHFKNWAMLKKPHDVERMIGIVGTRVGPLTKYKSWEDGLRDWCEIVRDLYVRRLDMNSVQSALIRIAQGSPSMYYSYMQFRLEQLQETDHDLGRVSVQPRA